jgi:hypothetical protein
VKGQAKQGVGEGWRPLAAEVQRQLREHDSQARVDAALDPCRRGTGRHDSLRPMLAGSGQMLGDRFDDLVGPSIGPSAGATGVSSIRGDDRPSGVGGSAASKASLRSTG